MNFILDKVHDESTVISVKARTKDEIIEWLRYLKKEHPDGMLEVTLLGETYFLRWKDLSQLDPIDAAKKILDEHEYYDFTLDASDMVVTKNTDTVKTDTTN